jgi:hypothetical protein
MYNFIENLISHISDNVVLLRVNIKAMKRNLRYCNRGTYLSLSKFKFHILKGIY